MALIRVSSTEQGADSRGGLDRQREVVNRTIANKNLQCIDLIELVDVSGTNTSTHPQIRDVLRRILNGEVRGLVMADIDRLFRPTEPSNFAMLQVFKDVGAKIYSGDFEYDLTTKDGLLFSSIRSAFAGFELNLMRERQMGACEAKRRRGQCPSNHMTLPFAVGYDRKTESWHFTPEIGVVADLFKMFDSGVTNYCELGRRAGMTPATVKVILRNPIYTGWRVIDKRRGPEKRVSKAGKHYRVKVDRPPDEVIRTKVLDGIITEEFHARVLAEMNRLKFNHHAKHKDVRSVHLGAGLCICGHCGLPMFHVWNKKRGRYICKSHYYLYRQRFDGGCKQCSLSADEVDAAIDAFASSVLRSPIHLQRILEASMARTRQIVTQFPEAVTPTVHIDELRKRRKRCLEAYLQGVIKMDEMVEARDEIDRKIASLAAMEKPKRRPVDDDLNRLCRIIVKAALRYPKITDLERRQQIIRQIFAELHVRDRQIVSFRFHSSLDTGSSGEGGIGHSTIILPKPVIIGPEPDILPDGLRRCIKCGEAKPTENFYRRLRRCGDCRRQEDRERWRKRREKKAAASGRP